MIHLDCSAERRTRRLVRETPILQSKALECDNEVLLRAIDGVPRIKMGTDNQAQGHGAGFGTDLRGTGAAEIPKTHRVKGSPESLHELWPSDNGAERNPDMSWSGGSVFLLSLFNHIFGRRDT